MISLEHAVQLVTYQRSQTLGYGSYGDFVRDPFDVGVEGVLLAWDKRAMVDQLALERITTIKYKA
jgi:hypothetical protein